MLQIPMSRIPSISQALSIIRAEETLTACILFFSSFSNLATFLPHLGLLML